MTEMASGVRVEITQRGRWWYELRVIHTYDGCWMGTEEQPTIHALGGLGHAQRKAERIRRRRERSMAWHTSDQLSRGPS